MMRLLSGENSYGIHHIVQKTIGDFVAAYGPHGVERVDGEAMTVTQLPDLLQGATLFTPQRLVVISHASLNKPVWEALADWVLKVADDTQVIIVESAPDKRTRTYKALKALPDSKELVQSTDSELMQWLALQAHDLGGTLGRAEAQYLLERAGRDQWRLAHEIEKVVSYQPEVTRQAIDELVEPSPEGNAFALLDASLAGDSARVNSLVLQLRTEEDPYKLFGLLASQVHVLALVAFAGTRNADQIARDAGVHPFVVRKTQGLAKQIGPERVRHIAAAVARCDEQLKSTGLDPWQLLGMTLQQVAAE